MKTHIVKQAVFLAGCLSTFTSLAQPAATVPHLINYQGVLVDSSGASLPDGNYTLSFNIYTNSVVGTPVWGPQIFDGQGGTGHVATVALIGGRFNVMLGPVDTNSVDIAAALGGTSRYLGITVSGTTNIVPLQQILSAPFALKAGNADTLGSAGGWELIFGPGVTNFSTAGIQGSRIQPASITSTQLASGSVSGTNLAPPLSIAGAWPLWLVQVTNTAGPAIGGFSPFSSGVVGQGAYNGVYGISAVVGGVGVRGEGQGVGVGVYAEGIPAIRAFGSAGGLAGEFIGNVSVNGTLSASVKPFKIDHPLDPANKYLYHVAVESPDMKDMYDGVAVLDSQGTATIQLPEWFGALNQDFRYQLTAVGAPAPNLHIAEEIAHNRFKIGGGFKGLKVSWQVTGIRHDAYANAHRIPVEEEKPAAERGTYLAPQEFGQPQEKGLHWKMHQPSAK